MIYTIAFALIFGYFDARKDFANLDTIVHGWKFWLSRALRFTVPAFLVAWLASEPLLWSVLASACLTTSVHRFTLNKLRGLPIQYISTSNGYDRFWISWFGANGGELAYIMELTTAALILWMRYL